MLNQSNQDNYNPSPYFITAKGQINAPPQLCEPSLSARAQQTLNHLDTLEGNFSDLRSSLFGEGENGPKQPSPSSLEGMLAEICTRVASLCGASATINSRIAR